MVRKIVKVKDPRLRKTSKKIQKVDKKIKALINDLSDTLINQKDPEGVGLAAPQIGKNLRLFVMKSKGKERVFINPKIVFSSDKSTKKVNQTNTLSPKKIMEGCLSLPHFYGPLSRPKKVRLEFTNELGKKRVDTFEGFEAQIIQHEIDHLNGVLFIDRLLEQKKPLYELVNGEWEEVELL